MLVCHFSVAAQATLAKQAIDSIVFRQLNLPT